MPAARFGSKSNSPSTTGLVALPGERATTGAGTSRVLAFHLADRLYGLPLAAVEQVIPMAALNAPPGMPSVLAGFLCLGGAAVAVVRLDRLFGLPAAEPGLHTPLIVLREGDPRLALRVDRMRGIVAVDESEMLPGCQTLSFNECVAGMFVVDKEPILLLSVERLLLEKEQQCLAEWHALEQVRLDALELPS